MKRVGSFLGDWWRLVVPYFKSEERWIAIALLVGAIVLTLSSVAVNVAYNEWSRRFFDTFQNKDEPGFWLEMINFSWIAGLTIAFAIARGLVSPYLRLRWRRWLTKQYLAHWLDSRGYYRIELERKIDNADQRISEDLRQLGLYTMQLAAGRDRRRGNPGLVPVHPVAALGRAVARLPSASTLTSRATWSGWRWSTPSSAPGSPTWSAAG